MPPSAAGIFLSADSHWLQLFHPRFQTTLLQKVRSAKRHNLRPQTDHLLVCLERWTILERKSFPVPVSPTTQDVEIAISNRMELFIDLHHWLWFAQIISDGKFQFGNEKGISSAPPDWPVPIGLFQTNRVSLYFLKDRCQFHPMPVQQNVIAPASITSPGLITSESTCFPFNNVPLVLPDHVNPFSIVSG